MSRASISVVICAYTTDRWSALVKAISSAHEQTRPAHEVILVVDHNELLLERSKEALHGTTVLANQEVPGLSGARNTGVNHATGEIVAFLDDDARAEPDWLKELATAYEEPAVVGAGGFVEPAWRDRPPRWLPSEFLWVVGCTYRGFPTARTAIRNPIGANMSFRRDAFLNAGGFTHEIGRAVSRPAAGCEETEFSIRVRQQRPDAVIMHVPTAHVSHVVTADRTTVRYFVSRCWAEGRSKALIASHVGRDVALASESSYATRTLPAGVLRELFNPRPPFGSGPVRAVAIIVGLLVTLLGFLRG